MARGHFPGERERDWNEEEDVDERDERDLNEEEDKDVEANPQQDAHTGKSKGVGFKDWKQIRKMELFR